MSGKMNIIIKNCNIELAEFINHAYNSKEPIQILNSKWIIQNFDMLISPHTGESKVFCGDIELTKIK